MNEINQAFQAVTSGEIELSASKIMLMVLVAFFIFSIFLKMFIAAKEGRDISRAKETGFQLAMAIISTLVRATVFVGVLFVIIASVLLKLQGTI